MWFWKMFFFSRRSCVFWVGQAFIRSFGHHMNKHILIPKSSFFDVLAVSNIKSPQPSGRSTRCGTGHGLVLWMHPTRYPKLVPVLWSSTSTLTQYWFASSTASGLRNLSGTRSRTGCEPVPKTQPSTSLRNWSSNGRKLVWAAPNTVPVPQIGTRREPVTG